MVHVLWAYNLLELKVSAYKLKRCRSEIQNLGGFFVSFFLFSFAFLFFPPHMWLKHLCKYTYTSVFAGNPMEDQLKKYHYAEV